MTLLSNFCNGEARVSIPDGSLKVLYDDNTKFIDDVGEGDELEIIGELRGNPKKCVCGYTSDEVVMYCKSVKKIGEGDSIW